LSNDIGMSFFQN